MKTKELIDMIMDLCKISSDDAFFTEEHVEWLLNKNRSFLLKREEERLKERMSDKNKQTICVSLKQVNSMCGNSCGQIYLKSTQKIPDIVSTSHPIISPNNMFQTNISYVPFQKFKYIGFNKYLKNIVFCTIGPDDFAYLISDNPVFQNMQCISITGVFDDFIEASKLSCDQDGEEQQCDSFEMEFPIDDYLVPELIDRVLRELLGAVYRPKDAENNAMDSLSYIANFIRNYVKKPLQQQLDGTTE